MEYEKFDELIQEALDNNEITPEQLALWGLMDVRPDTRPGKVGGVISRPTRVMQSDVMLEGSPDVVLYDPDQGSLWD